MNDISRFNYKDYPIYLIIIYDLEENQIQFFQKIPVVNFNWMKAQTYAHINYLLNIRKKSGKTLFNDLTDYNFTREIKVTSLKLNKNALVVFYNSCIDFYQIGPIVLNLRDCIQIVSQTNKIEPAKLKKKYVDINTILNDCLSSVNCSHRIMTKDLEAFSGKDGIYNEKCFMHLLNQNNLSALFRNHLGKTNYYAQVNKKNNLRNLIERKEAMIRGLKFKVNDNILKHHQTINSARYKKFNQKIAVLPYKLIKEPINAPLTNREESAKTVSIVKEKNAFTPSDKEKKFMSCSFISPSVRIIENEENTSASALATVDLDFDTLKQKGKINHSPNISPYHSQIVSTNTYTSYPDISNINSKIEQDHKNVIKSAFNRHDNAIFNEFAKNNQKEIEAKMGIIDTISNSLDFQTIATINQSVNQMSNKQIKDLKPKAKLNISTDINLKNNNNINMLTQTTMPIVNFVPSVSPLNQHSSYSSLWYDKKFQSQMIQTPTNKSAIMNTQFNIYNATLNNNKNMSVISNMSANDFNIQRFNSQKPSLTLPLNNITLVENNNTFIAPSNNNNSTTHITQNRLGIFNSVGGPSSISPSVSNNRMNQKIQQQDINLSNHRFPSSSLPPENNRYNNINITNTNFSEDDMSFLSYNNNQKKEYDDNIVLNKTNPDLMGDLREKYFYYFQKGTLIKSDGKGYIGLNFRNYFHINKKLFSLMLLQSKWKDQQYFSNKEYDHTMLTKLTEVDYRLECKNVSQDLKIITYFPNPLKIENLVAIKVKNDYNQSTHLVQFEINFSFNQHYISNVYRMLFNMFFRKPMPYQKANFKIIHQSHQPIQINNDEYRITFNTVVKTISFTIEALIPNPIDKIQFCFEMKDCIPSHNDIRINYNNSKLNQFSLNISKLSMIHYDYSL